jgi:hypothetical protein
MGGVKILGQVWFRFGLLLCGLGLFTAATAPALGREPRAYGERLVAQYRLPAEAIERYAALAAGTAGQPSPHNGSLFADAAPWIGPQQRVGVGHNPYILVLTISGVTRSAGAVYAQWQAGWEIHESPTTRREVLMAMPGIARAGLAAGEALSLSVSGARVSFRGERSVAPMLGLVQARNLAIDSVELQVWSGVAPVAWALPRWSRMVPLALGLACLLMRWRLNDWQRARPASASPLALRAEPQRSPLTQPPGAAPTAIAEPVLRTPAPAALSPMSSVLSALHQVLTLDPARHNVPDETRPRKPRARQALKARPTRTSPAG